MKIEIITTPNEKLRETGFGSLSSCQSVLESIGKLDHEVMLTVCNDLDDLVLVVNRQPDLVILAVKYISRESENDIWLSEFFEEHGINYSGSSREVLKFDSNKVLAKTKLIDKGLKTAKYFSVIPKQFTCEADLPLAFPLFLKPLNAANGNGIDDLSLVSNFAEFESKLSTLYTMYEVPVLAEEYLEGREFTVSVITTTSGKLVVSAVEIIPPESTIGLRILGEKTKSEDSELIKKIEVQEDLKNVNSLAVEAYKQLGIRDFGRIDIKNNKDGVCYFMEANLVPGMTSGSSYFPMACEIANQLTYDEVVQLIVEKGISRTLCANPVLIPVVIADNDGESLVAAM